MQIRMRKEGDRVTMACEEVIRRTEATVSLEGI